MTCMVKAQQYVSTEPANRNAVLEEFTGRTCGYCPDGHVIANGIHANNPGRFWAVNIHSEGYFSPTTYPNLNTAKGNQIRAAFNATSFPTGVVNRSTAAGQGRNAWVNLSNGQFNQAAECNIGGVAKINPDTRVADITVEVYYTGNSSYDENYLTIMMLQDSIMGSQSSGSSNPQQWVNGQYCHMHILRDIITATMGDVITPTTQGSLITKNYQYQIPESIGNPNGVEVKLEHISFIAFVSERYQGNPTRPILNVGELQKTLMTDEPLYPAISDLNQVEKASCDNVKSFMFEMTNIGTETINSVKFNAVVDNETVDFDWTGTLLSGAGTKVEFDMEIPFGTFNGMLNITEVNGEAYESSSSFVAESDEWVEVEAEGETTFLKIYIIQDQYGEQTTWDIINSAGAVLASGGPYAHLAGTGATQVNVATVNDLSTDDCYLFRIYDSQGNGICCNYGNGYYYIKDASGDKIVEGEGNFGDMAAHNISIRSITAVDDIAAATVSIYPNPANSEIFVEGSDVETVEVYNSVGQMVATVTGASDKTGVDVAAFDNGVYFVRVVAGDGSVITRKVTIVH